MTVKVNFALRRLGLSCATGVPTFKFGTIALATLLFLINWRVYIIIIIIIFAVIPDAVSLCPFYELNGRIGWRFSQFIRKRKNVDCSAINCMYSRAGFSWWEAWDPGPLPLPP